jgi:hypothetical protein
MTRNVGSGQSFVSRSVQLEKYRPGIWFFPGDPGNWSLCCQYIWSPKYDESKSFSIFGWKDPDQLNCLTQKIRNPGTYVASIY